MTVKIISRHIEFRKQKQKTIPHYKVIKRDSLQHLKSHTSDLSYLPQNLFTHLTHMDRQQKIILF